MTMCFFVSVLMHAELKWITPTPAELSMTAEPKAPGAPAIVLSYEETDDANTFETIIHARIKILTLGGLSAGNIELPRRLVDSDYFDQNIFARTIHPNGTIIPFVRSTQNTANTQDDASSNTVISLPSVEVGSILEYIFHFEVRFMYTEQLLSSYAPVWNAQRKYFMRSAHFRLNAPE